MKPSKQKVSALAIALAAVGWFVGRGMGSSVEAKPAPAEEEPRATVDPHVEIRAPELASRVEAAKSGDQRHPLQRIPDESYHPRDPNEWQGMPVDMSMRQLCDTSERCGLGLSCRQDGKCGPCEVDADCAGGEACVLDHCLPASNVECTARADCSHLGEDAYCVLSGLTGGEPRGNSEMKAYCLTGTGGEAQPEPDPDADAAPRFEGRAEAPPFDRRNLLDDLRASSPR